MCDTNKQNVIHFQGVDGEVRYSPHIHLRITKEDNGVKIFSIYCITLFIREDFIFA